MIELRGVAKHFGETFAIHPLDLHIPRGKTTVLIGPSGCGKTTLLRSIIGLITPDEGSIRIEDTVISAATARDYNWNVIRRRTGYVIQEGGLFPHLTARANVSLVARHLGWDAQRIADRVDELVGLTQFPRDGLSRYPGQLSGGQRQRVSLMRALMLDPDILLLDEPLGALDPLIRAELQTDLANIFQTLGKTVVMVTHDMAEAALFADTIVLMRSGRIVQQGTIRDLIDHPSDPFVSEFVHAQQLGHDALRARGA